MPDGSMRLDGTEFRSNDFNTLHRAGVLFVPADRLEMALFPALNLMEHIKLTFPDRKGDLNESTKNNAWKASTCVPTPTPMQANFPAGISSACCFRSCRTMLRSSSWNIPHAALTPVRQDRSGTISKAVAQTGVPHILLTRP